jgi:protein-tyrosine phosphatase
MVIAMVRAVFRWLLRLHPYCWQDSNCPHPLTKVKVGSHFVFAGAAKNLKPEAIAGANISLYVPLTTKRVQIPEGTPIKALEMPDFGGVPANWRQSIDEFVAKLGQGAIMLFHCDGGHGRTGTLLASLIAVAEPETSDPIAAVRERYCKLAVETTAQAEAIFALRKQRLPQIYRGTFPGDYCGR